MTISAKVVQAIVILGMVGGAIQADVHKDVEQGTREILNFTRTQVTLFEMSNMGRQLRLAQLHDHAPAHEQDFEAFLLEEFEQQEERDVTRDHWGEPYTLDIQPDRFLIVSNGPDRELNTEDDLRVSVKRYDTRREQLVSLHITHR